MTMDRIEKRIVTLLREFPLDTKEQVLAFVEFLQTRIERPSVPTEPLTIPRPTQETVVKAIRRLSATYPMLDRGKILTETSTLMSQHVLGGREAAEVIDDLERLFQEHFERSKD